MPSPSQTAAEFPSLLQAARGGDRVAQGQLFERYRAQVERIAHRQLRRAQAGRGSQLAARFSTGDVVQEAFFELLAKLDRFQGSSEGEFVSYVTQLVRHRVIDAVRFHRASPRDHRRQLAAVESTAPDPLEGLVAPEAPALGSRSPEHFERRYRKALAELPKREREVLNARIEERRNFTDIAKTLGYSSRYAARRAFFAAQARLSLLLGAKDDTPPPLG